MLKKIIPAMALALCAAGSASAGTYSFDGVFNNGTGCTFTFDTMLTTVATSDSTIDLITNVTGTFDGSSIVSFAANPTFPNYSTIVNIDGGGANVTYDNVFLNSSKSLDDNGVVLTLANGQKVSLWGNSSTSAGYFSNWSGTGHDFNGSAVIASVPEPETYGMMLAGLGLIGWIARRKKAA